MNKLAILVASVSSLSVVALGVYTWISMGDVSMTVNGYVALVLGVTATLIIGVALMALLFYSNRAGFDERAARAVKQEEPRAPIER